MNVRVDCEESNDTSASKSTKDEEANNQVVPSGCLHGLVLEPWLLVFALESVAFEDSLRAHVGVCLVEALDRLIWCGAIEMAGVAAILIATDGCRCRHCDGVVDDQAQVMVPDLQQCLLRNRKVSQQEHDRSKSDKNLKTLSGRVPYGVLALSGKAAEKANTPNREQGYSHLRGTVLRLADMSQKNISTTSGHFIVVSSAAAVQYRKSAGLAWERDAIVVPSAIVELEGD